jgi:hypothetical protein
MRGTTSSMPVLGRGYGRVPERRSASVFFAGGRGQRAPGHLPGRLGAVLSRVDPLEQCALGLCRHQPSGRERASEPRPADRAPARRLAAPPPGTSRGSLRPQTSASHRRRRVRLRALPPPSRVALRRRGPPAAAWSAGSGDLLAYRSRPCLARRHGRGRTDREPLVCRIAHPSRLTPRSGWTRSRSSRSPLQRLWRRPKTWTLLPCAHYRFR